jgi:DNA-binding GntR family transcriptional regulator
MAHKASSVSRRDPAGKAVTRQKTKPAAATAGLEEHPQQGKVTDAPLYLQIAGTLRAAIVRGIYPVGSRIPTEEELCERFQVSRHTIREALRRLREDGLITSRNGSRPIVVPPSAQTSVRLWSAEISRDFFDHTMRTRLAVESMEMVQVTKTLALRFGIPQGEDWLRVCGYRHSGEHEPAVGWYDYMINADYAAVGRLIPRHVGPLILLVEDFFSEKITHIKYSMSAVEMPAERASTLRVAAGSPSLNIVARCETSEKKLAMVTSSLHRGGDVGYSIALQDSGQ